MEKEFLKEAILSALSQELDSWLEESPQIKDGHEYEERYMAFSQKVNKLMLEKSIGVAPKDRKKKNFIPVSDQ